MLYFQRNLFYSGHINSKYVVSFIVSGLLLFSLLSFAQAYAQETGEHKPETKLEKTLDKQVSEISAQKNIDENDQMTNEPVIGENSGLKLPRFVSLSSSKVRARSGPGLRYPIEWIYTRDGLPVEVVKEFENWRKILDIDGQGGWVHVSLLSGDRTALINTNEIVMMRDAPLESSRALARLEPTVVVDIERCLDSWCRIRRADFSGWIERNFLWGIYAGEEIN